MTPPRIAGLCSGYGGLEQGLVSVVGGSVAWHCENDQHAAKVLATRYPGVPNHQVALAMRTLLGVEQVAA